MLNIKNVFSPPQTEVPTAASPVTANVTSSSSNVGPSNPTPAFHPAKKSFLKQPKAILGGLLMLVLVIGGVSAFSLSQEGQDLRQQASGKCTADKQCPDGWYCNKNKGECKPPTNSGECRTSADCPGGGTMCLNNKCISNDQPTKPPITSPIPTNLNGVTCTTGIETFKEGQHSCADNGAANCVVCGKRVTASGGVIGVWLSDPGNCGDNKKCGGALPSPFPTLKPGQLSPTPNPSGIQSCAGEPNKAVNCTEIAGPTGLPNRAVCGSYKTCNIGGGYNACDKVAGTNGCKYTKTDGSICVGQCPDTIGGTGMVRCQCTGTGLNDGIWTIGVLPPGGSCAQLCACTGNTCLDCVKPTKKPPGPTDKPKPSNTPIPTLPPGPQCTTIKMFDMSNNELTGNEDKGLKPGQAVKFSCAGTGTIGSYEFRVILPDGTVHNKANTPALNTNTNITGGYALPMSGRFTAQCRICYQPPCPAGQVCTQVLTCLPYENIASTPSTGITNAPTRPPQPGVLCGNSRCAAHQTCYQPPMPTCRAGTACAEIMPAPYCRDKAD